MDSRLDPRGASGPAAFERLSAPTTSVLRLHKPSAHRRTPDVYQEAFCGSTQLTNSVRCSFQTRLYRIVTNLCLDQLQAQDPAGAQACRPADGVATAGGAEERADGDPSAHLQPAIEVQIDQVLSAAPRERVFEMRHYQGLRLRAIGEVLGTTEEAAKNCLFRATQKMRRALGDFL
jgi:RNA polymerase sigma-70 factor (ECF subfamily)